MTLSEPSKTAGSLHEYFGNIHMHTTHSDGTGTFDDLIDGAVRGRLDFVFVTDHNLLVREEEEGYRKGVLTLVGQEVNDKEREISGNHLLCLGVETDVSHLAKDPQVLIDAVGRQDALPFLAHPIEEYTKLFPHDFSWHSWDVSGYHGVELWNYMSSFRGLTTSHFRALLVGFLPHLFTVGPLPAMLQKWDELTQQGPVVALGGTDVHAMTYRMGPISRCFLPYDHCAKAVNTHILTETPFLGQPQTGDTDFMHRNVEHDRQLVLNALRQGRCWVGYDLAASTKGFRFWGEKTPDPSSRHSQTSASREEAASMPDPSSGEGHSMIGDAVTLPVGDSLRLHVQSPQAAEIRLLRNGRLISQGRAASLSYDVRDSGVYRVEVWLHRWGKLRGWIFSNPIYVYRPASDPQ